VLESPMPEHEGSPRGASLRTTSSARTSQSPPTRSGLSLVTVVLLGVCAALSVVGAAGLLPGPQGAAGEADSEKLLTGGLLMLLSAGVGCWIAVSVLLQRPASSSRAMAVIALAACLLPPGYATYARMRTEPAVARPGRDPLTTQRPQPAAGQGSAQLFDRLGRINPDATGAERAVKALEDILYAPEPTSLAAVCDAWAGSGKVLGSMGSTFQDRVPRGEGSREEKRADQVLEALEGFRYELVHSVVVWSSPSSFANHRSRWEKLRDRIFSDASWFRHGTPELDTVQRQRDPPEDYNLWDDINTFEGFVQDLESRTELDTAWVEYAHQTLGPIRRRSVRFAVATTREPDRRKRVDPTHRRRCAPRDLIGAYEAINTAYGRIGYHFVTPHWADAATCRRVAHSTRSNLESARKHLEALKPAKRGGG